MEASGVARFEIYWEGAYVSKEKKEVRCINVKMKDVLLSIEGRINKRRPFDREQHLQIHTELLEGDKLKKFSSRKNVSSFACLPQTAMTMKISARILECYEDQSPRGQMRASRYDQSIPLGGLLNFESGRTYQIKVTRQNEKFSATFHEKIGEGKALFDSGIQNLTKAAFMQQQMNPNMQGPPGNQIEKAGAGL